MKFQRHMKIGLGSGSAAVFGALFGFVAFPALINSGLKKEMSLSDKNDIRALWSKVPFAIDFKVYLFNCTNAEEVQKGATPVLKEVGPYYFEEWKEKVNLEDVEDEDAIVYNRLDTFYFRKELSGKGLTGDEIIVMPHVMMLSLAIVVANEKPAMLNLIGKALKGIFDDPQDVFLRARAMDIMFDGVLINCARTDFAPKAICTAIKKEASNLEFLPGNQFKFSFFGMRNATPDGVAIKVRRGIKNIMEVGQVIGVNGETEQSVWAGMPCNQLAGTDGTVFPPFLTYKDRLESFSPDICRTVRPEFQKFTSYNGIPTNRYVATLGDLGNDPELSCLCSAPDKCPKKGLMDLFKCLKAPLVASLPHFLETDPSVLAGVKGLSPNEEEHRIVIDFEPITGTPMVARQRLMFSIELKNIDKLELFKDLPGSLVPLFWVEEGLALNATFVKMMKSQLFTPKRAVGVIKWLLVSFGSLGLIGSALVHYKDKIMKFAVSPDTPVPLPKKEAPAEGKELSVISA